MGSGRATTGAPAGARPGRREGPATHVAPPAVPANRADGRRGYPKRTPPRGGRRSAPDRRAAVRPVSWPPRPRPARRRPGRWMPPSVSVVVPTLNEERALPQLLRALAGQTRPAGELIVADGGSADGTRGLAAAAGARVVAGGTPAVGRNRGAAAAAAPLVVFLDADVVPPPRFLELAVGEFEARRLDVATCLAVPLSRRWVDRALHGATNAYYLATAGFAPHGSGFCLLARKALHEAIRGFAEHLTVRGGPRLRPPGRRAGAVRRPAPGGDPGLGAPARPAGPPGPRRRLPRGRVPPRGGAAGRPPPPAPPRAPARAARLTAGTPSRRRCSSVTAASPPSPAPAPASGRPGRGACVCARGPLRLGGRPAGDGEQGEAQVVEGGQHARAARPGRAARRAAR